MNGASAIETEYVSQKIFDLQLKNVRERAEFNKEVVDERLDRNMAEVKAMFAEIRSEINSFRSEMRAEISDIRGEIKILHTEIKATNDRFDDMKEYQNKWFTVFGILFTAAAIIAPVAVAVVQHFMGK